MAYTFNATLFREIVVKAAGPIYIEQAFKEAQAIFESDKQEMLKEFDNHPVTEEIKEGPDGTNISQTLGGYGNLFSFIGFDRSDKPTEPVREVLDQSTTIQKVGRGAVYNKDSIDYSFPVFIPLMDVELQNAAPMPWGTARSWLKAIENPLGGLNYYLYRRNYDFGEISHSGPAIQVNGEKANQAAAAAYSAKIGNPVFKPISYLTEILNKFKAKYK